MNGEKVIHQAGEPQGLVQACARCGFVLTDYRNSMSTGDWEPRWWTGNVEVSGVFPIRFASTVEPATCNEGRTA